LDLPSELLLSPRVPRGYGLQHCILRHRLPNGYREILQSGARLRHYRKFSIVRQKTTHFAKSIVFYKVIERVSMNVSSGSKHRIELYEVELSISDAQELPRCASGRDGLGGPRAELGVSSDLLLSGGVLKGDQVQ
jgi:hypothetical protein